jgi:hypothetical protein
MKIADFQLPIEDFKSTVVQVLLNQREIGIWQLEIGNHPGLQRSQRNLCPLNN